MAGNRFLAPSAGYSIRDPLTKAQQHGVVKSPPRWNDTLGGLTGPEKGVKRNQFKIRKPGNTAG